MLGNFVIIWPNNDFLKQKHHLIGFSIHNTWNKVGAHWNITKLNCMRE